MSIASLMNMVYANGSVVSTDNVRFFPFYYDDPAATGQTLELSLRGWKHAVEKWEQGEGRTCPAPLPQVPSTGERYAYLEKIWDWIPDLGLYGKDCLRTCVHYLDRARMALGDLSSFEPPVVSEAMSKAIRNLWEHRPISRVLNRDMVEALLNQSGFTVAPHIGNCTDVVIGIARMQSGGFEDLLAAYQLARMKNSVINDLFDLSVLTGLIVALKASGQNIPSSAAVESEVLRKLVPPQVDENKRAARGVSNAVPSEYVIPIEPDQTLPSRMPPPPWFPSVFAGSAKWPKDMSDEELSEGRSRLGNLVKAMQIRQFVPPDPRDSREARARLQAIENEIARRKV